MVWGGCPLFSRLGGLESVVSSPSGVRGGTPAENRFWSILKTTERSFLYLYDKICGGQFALSSPYSKFWGDVSPLSPRDLRPCVCCVNMIDLTYLLKSYFNFKCKSDFAFSHVTFLFIC